MISYISIFMVALGISVWGWRQNIDSGLGFLASVGGTMITILLYIGSFLPVWEKSIECFNTTSTKVGSEIVVQSPGLPTQMVTDIKFSDQPLVIVKTTKVNLYNLDETSKYSVQIKK